MAFTCSTFGFLQLKLRSPSPPPTLIYCRSSLTSVMCYATVINRNSTNFWRKNRTIIKGILPAAGNFSCHNRSVSISYQKFIDFALDETSNRFDMVPSPLQENFNNMSSEDGEAKIHMLSFQAPKMRLMRSLNIETAAMQVLDFAIFPEQEFDVPIFCANFFSTSNTNIVVLDLNPLYNTINHKDYKEKYYADLMSLGLRYSELLPWGGKLTGESIKFFSPIVIWTRFSSSQSKYDILYSAFREYLKAWLDLISQTAAQKDLKQIFRNREAQHKYLTWRAEKDPGQAVLEKLVGDTLAKSILRNFLFNGVEELGTKKFLDYFPEYRCDDGTINKKRSVAGKSFESRPWNASGEFIDMYAFDLGGFQLYPTILC